MSPEGSGTPGRLTSLGTPCVSLPLRAEKTPLPHPDSGLIGAPSPSSPSVLSRTSPLGSQKGCRRQGWHTAGWVGAGSQLGPAGRDLGAQLAPGASGGPHRGLFEIACGSKNRTVGATLLSQHLIQILKSTLPGPAPCRDRAGPTPPPAPRVLTGLESPSPPRGGPSTDRMARMGIRVNPITQDREKSTQLPTGGRRKSPERGCQVRRTRRTGSHRLCCEPYLHRGLGRPCPPRPCRGSGGGGSRRSLRSPRSAPLLCAQIGCTHRKGHKDPRSSSRLRLRLSYRQSGSAPRDTFNLVPLAKHRPSNELHLPAGCASESQGVPASRGARREPDRPRRPPGSGAEHVFSGRVSGSLWARPDGCRSRTFPSRHYSGERRAAL